MLIAMNGYSLWLVDNAETYENRQDVQDVRDM
jgi:hypothetical protein